MFRQDLLTRLEVVTISVPPLRGRIEDVPMLAEHFCESLARQCKPVSRSQTSQWKRLCFIHWPGNVREVST